jgi:hypothetical protein
MANNYLLKGSLLKISHIQSLQECGKNFYYQKVEYLVFSQHGKARAKFIVLPRISHTKVWEIGVGSKQKCGKT